MSESEIPSTYEPVVRPLTFKNGGWLLITLAVVSTFAVVFMLMQRQRTVGDGLHPESYGFDLNGTLVPRDLIVAGGLPRDFFPAAVNPRMAPAEIAEAESGHRQAYSRFLAKQERVVGIVINGEAHAYPVAILQEHAVVNDVVGGVPIAVTYDPLCDSVVAFARTVQAATADATNEKPGAEDKVLEFGSSGLLYNSNMLLYDRQSDAKDMSLWSQLQWRAVAGPAARRGATLKLVPAALLDWETWKAQHPATLVLMPDAAVEAKMDKMTFTTYFATDELKFPVRPMWDATAAGSEKAGKGLARKTPIAAMRVSSSATIGTWRVFVLPRLAKMSAPERTEALKMDGATLTWHEATGTITAAGDAGRNVETVYCFWFAWYAMHPEAGALPPG